MICRGRRHDWARLDQRTQAEFHSSKTGEKFMGTYELFFQGFWNTSSTDHLPKYQGIYGVYTGSPPTSLVVNTPSIDKLIYIGMAGNINTRVFDPSHHGWNVWHSQLRHDQQIYFNTAYLEHESDMRRAEAAMIFQHKPVCNDIGKDRFVYELTMVTTSGQNFKMFKHFLVNPT